MKGFALGLLLPALAVASEVPFVPSGLVHQGRMLGQNDEPVTGKLEMTFSLYAQANGGNALWQEVQEVPFESGYYSVVLGDPSRDGNVMDPTLFAGPLFLGVRVGTNQELQPRMQVATVPFALRAALANSVVGGTIQSATIKDSTIVDPASIRVGERVVFDASGRYVGPDDQLNASFLGNVPAADYLLNADAEARYVRKSGDEMTGTLTTTGELRGQTLVSTTTSGPPLRVASSEMVRNLNAEFLAGLRGSDYVTQTEFTAHSFENLSLNSSFERAGTGGLPAFFEAHGPQGAAGGRTLVPVTTVGVAPPFGQLALRVVDSDPNAAVAVRQQLVPQGQAAALAGRSFTASVRVLHDIGEDARAVICIVDAGDPFAPGAEPPGEGEPRTWTCNARNVEAQSFDRLVVTHTVSAAAQSLWVVFGPTPPGVTPDNFKNSGAVFDGLMVVEGTHRPAWSAHLAERLAENSVVGTVLVDASITGDKVLAGTLTGTHFAANSIPGNRLTNNSVSPSKLQMGTGSGLNADKLDGLDATAFMRTNPSNGITETSGSFIVRGAVGVGIDPVAGSARLHVRSSDAVQMRVEGTGAQTAVEFARNNQVHWTMGTDGNDALRFASGASPSLVVAKNGSVGIGLASPAVGTRLHVGGNVRVDGVLETGCEVKVASPATVSSCGTDKWAVGGGCAATSSDASVTASRPSTDGRNWECGVSSGNATTTAICCRQK